ncbi:hypothetical protein DICPUDRAFT_154875 [Dictyostelium purpureum]|uniref:Uncharacterized protein n=1 Tax=Dictyostelium purpureum TaxID=5786 RepID=F0ZSI2_DICPU|nr:uncharacterized protein DICPUDRAFT_154875 [Dictyostelium purpureum]EGC33107.1 hypothetical protein DICPUDRAFT_154875 [Dictyostelium purpureum]|eukprot:XP_003290384.1 hypothetical protein DICPUDRAFT_154875 [Dictyostelium purpureum]
MNSTSISTPLRPVSLPNLNLGKFWTSSTISGWVDSIYSQSEVYIKHEKDLREEELKQQLQNSGPGSSNEPIDIDGMDINNNNNNNNNTNSNNINSNNNSNGNNMSTAVNTSGSYHNQNNLFANRS